MHALLRERGVGRFLDVGFPREVPPVSPRGGVSACSRRGALTAGRGFPRGFGRRRTRRFGIARKKAGSEENVAERNLAIFARAGNAVDEQKRAEELAERAVLVRALRGVVTTWKRGNGGTCRA